MIDISQAKLVFHVSLSNNGINYDHNYIYINLKNILINDSSKLQDYCIIFKENPKYFLLHYNTKFINLQQNILNFIMINNRMNVILNIYNQIKLYISDTIDIIGLKSENINIHVDLEPINFFSYGKLSHLSYYKLSGSIPASKDTASNDAASNDAAIKDTASKDTASKDAANNLYQINKQLLSWIDTLFKNELVKKMYVNEILNIFPKSDMPFAEYSDNIKLFLSYICVKKEKLIIINNNNYDLLLMNIYDELHSDIKKIINFEIDKVIHMIHANENISSDKFINECNTIINKIYVDDIILSIKNELENINKFLQKSMSLKIIDNIQCQQKLINQYNCILIEMSNYLLIYN